MNEEHSRPFTPVLLSLLLPLTASSPCFLSNLHPRTHTHTAMHKCTYINTKPVAHTKQVFILSDVSLLSMFLHLCVYMCVRTLVFPLLSGLPTTNIPPSLFPSFSLPLSPCTSFSLYPLWAAKDKRNLSSRSQPSPHKNCYIHILYNRQW